MPRTTNKATPPPIPAGWTERLADAVAGLGREMSTLYESGERPAVAVAFLRACADAMGSVPVGAALEVLPRFVPLSPMAV